MRQSTENEDRSKEAECRVNDPPPALFARWPPPAGEASGGHIAPKAPPNPPFSPSQPRQDAAGRRAEFVGLGAENREPAGRRARGPPRLPRRAGVSELQQFHLQMKQFHPKVKHAPAAAARCYQ